MQEEQTPKDVFISYRRSQIDLVEPVLKELENRGISYFIDRSDISPGLAFKKIIENAIKTCKIFLLFWTADINDSEHIANEVDRAIENKRKILPYRIGDFDPNDHDNVIYALGRLNRINCPQQTPETIEEIVNHIEAFLRPAIDIASGKQAGERTTVIINGVEFAFRWCPPGTFKMGSPESEVGRCRDETPHTVTLTKGFWMMESEVTQKQWEAVMGSKSNPSNNRGDDLPVEMVTWFDCKEFCRRTNLQLPTEAQWEYACRAGSAGPYAGKLEQLSWFQSNSNDTTHPVRNKKPNKWGLYDMHGLLWEWCEDWYGSYPSGCVTDPTGPANGTDKVRRGGGKGAKAETCRSAQRRYEHPQNRQIFIGFRCVKVQ
ncbi:MAG: SUMF1/EgtB/PvdO family nonheme iron enzyme [Thermoguttaceae bacterium]|nr:SUMF1/EgtB/PvdO family nonheme iron enzyme [Thermoguttaceae bacterium]